MGTPNTIDICANCGEPVEWPNNTGAWIHLIKHPNNVANDTCVIPHVRNRIASRSDLSVATNGKAKNRT